MTSAASAVLVLNFDATFQVGDFVLRWQTLGIAVAVLAGLAWCALIAGRTPAFEARTEASPDGQGADRAPSLRRDDLLFIVLGVLPGAVIFGRLGYGLLHVDWYAQDWRMLLDPSGGSLELTGAVVGGTLTGVYVAALLDAPVGRWLHVAIRPLLLLLALGKAAEILGGGGQGALEPGGGGLAIAYVGSGPWGSPGAELPAIPAQLMEAAMTACVLALVAVLGWRSSLRRADGRLFALGLAAWAVGRAAVAATWRDEAVLGPLKAGQLICLGVAALAYGLAVLAPFERRRPGAGARAAP